MALLRDSNGQVHVLSARHLVGRGPHCTLRLDDPRVSSEHASLHWVGGAWQLRDLASRNGTYLRGQRVQDRVGLAEGDELAFGGSDGPRYTLERSGPPVAQARVLATGQWIDGECHQLVLPDAEHPVATVSELDGRWTVELVETGERRSVVSGEQVDVGGTSFELLLPAAGSETVDAEPTRLATARITLLASRDQEYVVMEIASANGVVRVEHHAFHDALLALARARLDDRARGVDDAEQGWLYIDELARVLHSSRERINLDVFRARQHLSRLGYEDAGTIVERRPASRALRWGTSDVVIGSL